MDREAMAAAGRQQTPPMKIYRSVDLLAVAVPMAGVGPGDISVEVTADGRLVVEGRLRADPTVGCASGNQVLLDEWTLDSYRREIVLSDAVDGPAATLTYGNGVLVVALPIIDRLRPARLALEPLSATRGERAGGAAHAHRRRGT
jgi:HSP20 family protein